MHAINRRKALTVVASVPAAVALSTTALASVGEPSELAALVRRYFAEIDAFNTFARNRTDEEADAFAASTFEKTMRQIVGVPARTRKDALAALEFLEREEFIETWVNDGEGLSESLVAAIRGYIEAGAA
jgi:hypothetical protein